MCVVLIREDDNDKSDDEDERIDFSSNQHAIERQKVKESFLRAEHGKVPVILNLCLYCSNYMYIVMSVLCNDCINSRKQALFKLI